MTRATRRRHVSTGLLTALLAIILALPFVLIHPVLPFTILFCLGGLLLLCRRWRWLKQLSMAYWIGLLVALVVLLPAVSILSFVEQGFDDGPFYGQEFRGTLPTESVSDRLPYRQGELLVYNRQAGRAPVLAYQAEDDMQWAAVMDVSANERYADYELTAISDLSLAYGILRDRLNFQATWSFGTESGRAYLWKWGGLHRFFLSW